MQQQFSPHPQDKIKYLSQQIQLDPSNIQTIQQRSQAFTVEGRVDQAISDYTKLIHLTQSKVFYVQRSQLFKIKGKYSQALKDLSTARSMTPSQLEEDDPATEIYLSNSVCMTHLQQAEQMARLIQTHHQPENQYNQTMQQLLEIKKIQAEAQQKRQRQIEELKKYYQEQNQQLKNVLFAQLKEMQEKISCISVDYEIKFLKELAVSGLKEKERKKIKLYFQYFVSQMEKYYIAAKNLHKIQDKHIKFQDFQGMIENKQNNDYLKILYKFFDKYGSQVAKVQQLIQHVPYIGSAFKIIKTSMKAKGWLEHINIESQCQNIERIAINTTSFNQYSTNLAYYLSKKYEKDILSQNTVLKSNWEILTLRIKKLKQQKLGKKGYNHEVDKWQQLVQDYGIIHASIIMIAYACNQLKFEKSTMSEINQEYEKDEEGAMKKLQPIFKVIGEVQNTLKSKYSVEKQSKDKSTGNSYCCIY